MINCYVKGENGLELGGTGIGSLADDSIWIDLNEPTVDEDNAVERHYSLDVPTGDEMRDLETSNRLYVENDLLYMTITLAISVDTPLPETTAVSFIVSPARLITVRYADSVPFKRWLSYAGTHAAACTTPLAIFSGLMQSVIGELARRYRLRCVIDLHAPQRWCGPATQRRRTQRSHRSWPRTRLPAQPRCAWPPARPALVRKRASPALCPTT